MIDPARVQAFLARMETGEHPDRLMAQEFAAYVVDLQVQVAELRARLHEHSTREHVA